MALERSRSAGDTPCPSLPNTRMPVGNSLVDPVASATKIGRRAARSSSTLIDTIGTFRIAPADARMAFGLYGSAHRGSTDRADVAGILHAIQRDRQSIARENLIGGPARTLKQSDDALGCLRIGNRFEKRRRECGNRNRLPTCSDGIGNCLRSLDHDLIGMLAHRVMHTLEPRVGFARDHLDFAR